jgi:hypothetical protein
VQAEDAVPKVEAAQSPKRGRRVTREVIESCQIDGRMFSSQLITDIQETGYVSEAGRRLWPAVNWRSTQPSDTVNSQAYFYPIPSEFPRFPVDARRSRVV